MSQGTAPMSEPITVTYLDLEHLIDSCDMTDDQRKVVELMMQGYTRTDIADMCKCKPTVISDMLNEAVTHIVERNEYEWHRCQAARKRAGLQ